MILKSQNKQKVTTAASINNNNNNNTDAVLIKHLITSGAKLMHCRIKYKLEGRNVC